MVSRVIRDSIKRLVMLFVILLNGVHCSEVNVFCSTAYADIKITLVIGE